MFKSNVFCFTVLDVQGGTMSEVKKFSIFLGVMIFFVALLIYANGKVKLDTYEAHQWYQVDAVYQKTTSKKYDDLDYTETEYTWHYEYVINGQRYACSVQNASSQYPNAYQYIKKIMVAKDNSAIYLLYEDVEDLKSSLSHNVSKIIVYGGVYFALFCVVMKIIKKRRRCC